MSIDRLIKRCLKIPDGCWLWQGGRTSNGYGNISINNKSTSTHRVMWTELHGEIPKGLLVLHKCDVKHCINPQHLFLGTHKDNSTDMVSKGRSVKYWLGKKRSAEDKIKMGLPKRGKKLSEEHAKALAKSLVGHVISNETRRKISEGNKNKPKSQSHKQALKAAWVKRRMKPYEDFL